MIVMNVVMMTSIPAADCSTFLPLRRKKLDRQWFGDGSVVQRYNQCRGRRWKFSDRSATAKLPYLTADPIILLQNIAFGCFVSQIYQEAQLIELTETW